MLDNGDKYCYYYVESEEYALTGIYILLGIIAVVFGYVGYELYKFLKTDFGISDITDLDE